uniref:Uncharacterized protein n=1 Tax=Opuntia streptacantha TaxID=393608 RepID=A0A7C8YW05_OPUST
MSAMWSLCKTRFQICARLDFSYVHPQHPLLASMPWLLQTTRQQLLQGSFSDHSDLLLVSILRVMQICSSLESPLKVILTCPDSSPRFTYAPTLPALPNMTIQWQAFSCSSLGCPLINEHNPANVIPSHLDISTTNLKFV